MGNGLYLVCIAEWKLNSNKNYYRVLLKIRAAFFVFSPMLILQIKQ